MKTIGYAAHSRAAALAPFAFERRALRSNDVSMEILYCTPFAMTGAGATTPSSQAMKSWGESLMLART